MKHLFSLKAFALVLIVLPLAWTRLGIHHEVAGLPQEEISAIFNQADRYSEDSSLTGEELPNALTEAVRNIFRINSYYVDEEMIKAIVDDNLMKKVPSHFSRSSFTDFVATVPSTVRNFRETIFDYLLRTYDVEGLMEDQEIATEVYKNPDVFGLTYSAYRVLSFNFDEAARKIPTYTETRTTIESNIREPENLNRNIQEEINRITEGYVAPPVLNDEVIGGPGATGGVDTFAENVAHIPGKVIEVDQIITEKIGVAVIKGNAEEGIDGAYAEVEVKTERKLNPSDL